MTSCKRIFWKIFMITKLLVTPEKYRLIMLYNNITGGLVYALSWRTMFKDAALVSILKLSETLQNPHFYPQKALNQPDLSLIVQWTWLLTCHLPMALILSWSWDQVLTKEVILIPCNKTITAEDTGKFLFENLYKQLGLPDKIISDRGPQFASNSFKELLKLVNIKSALSTAYHPQTDGTTKRVNQEIEAYLSIYCTSHPEDWPTALHLLEFTHNNWQHADRQKTPFELMFGESPIALPLTFKNTKFPAIEDRMKMLIKNQEEALAAHELACLCMADRRKSTFTLFKKGEKVWLDSRNMKMRHNKKMKPKQEGPFLITEFLGPVTYHLQLPASWQIHNIFHATLLKPYKKNEIYGPNFPEPPSELENNEEVYEVDYILNHWKRGWGYQYYIKWNGYPISKALWEPEQAFSDDGDMLSLYKQWHQLWTLKKMRSILKQTSMDSVTPSITFDNYCDERIWIMKNSADE